MNKKELTVVLTITAIVIVIWVISDILHAQTNLEPDPRVEKTSTPLNPQFDQQALEKINSVSTPRPVSNAISSAEPTPTPKPTPRPTRIATPSAQVATSSADSL